MCFSGISPSLIIYDTPIEYFEIFYKNDKDNKTDRIQFINYTDHSLSKIDRNYLKNCNIQKGDEVHPTTKFYEYLVFSRAGMNLEIHDSDKRINSTHFNDSIVQNPDYVNVATFDNYASIITHNFVLSSSFKERKSVLKIFDNYFKNVSSVKIDINEKVVKDKILLSKERKELYILQRECENKNNEKCKVKAIKYDINIKTAGVSLNVAFSIQIMVGALLVTKIYSHFYRI